MAGEDGFAFTENLLYRQDGHYWLLYFKHERNYHLLQEWLTGHCGLLRDWDENIDLS